MLRQGIARCPTRAMAAAAASRSPIVTAAELMASTEAPRVFEVTWFPGAPGPSPLFTRAAVQRTYSAADNAATHPRTGASEETQADFETGHILGASQLDVQADLSIPLEKAGGTEKLNFTRGAILPPIYPSLLRISIETAGF